MGVYLLPADGKHEQALEALADGIIEAGGMAYLLPTQSRDATQETEFRSLFDRSEDYAQFTQLLASARLSLSGLSSQELTRLLRRLRREYDAIRTTDHFPNDASQFGETLWMDFVNVVETALSPGEPQAVVGQVPRIDANDYQGRTWATRKHLWIDRVASAWLIRRFIDPKARFLWIDTPADCPPDALGFDFDGALFTHIGDRVSFEVLMTSFGLDGDHGLTRLGEMVHALDIGGPLVPEAIGFEAIISGARRRTQDDDQLLNEIGAVLDSLYAHFSNGPGQQRSPM